MNIKTINNLLIKPSSGGVSAYSSKNTAGTSNLNGYSLELYLTMGK